MPNPPLEPPFPTSLPPSYKRVPQTPPSKLLSSPRRSTPRVPVAFELIGAPTRGLGIPMRELVVRSGGALERMIVDANEPVGYLMSGSLGIRKVSLKIMVISNLAALFSELWPDVIIQWPGYDHVDWSHCLDLFSSAGPVTRGELAVQIATAFSAYVAQMAAQTPSPNVAGWRLGSSSAGGMAFERLVLIALWNTCDDHWMAEVYIDSR
ncbi:hypothetical protein J3R82DRAFT_4842 [Butyriboletus roseoflavus]|nr:hypothetical protein J3R82DRAFT_4842 [Butyriboletus roseoflavus]